VNDSNVELGIMKPREVKGYEFQISQIQLGSGVSGEAKSDLYFSEGGSYH